MFSHSKSQTCHLSFYSLLYGFPYKTLLLLLLLLVLLLLPFDSCCLLLLNIYFLSPRYGEVVNINLVRDKKTGKSKGFCFICYEDQRSTILSVDNFNGIKVQLHSVLFTWHEVSEQMLKLNNCISTWALAPRTHSLSFTGIIPARLQGER